MKGAAQGGSGHGTPWVSWYSGQVKFNGEWRSEEEYARLLYSWSEERRRAQQHNVTEIKFEVRPTEWVVVDLKDKTGAKALDDRLAELSEEEQAAFWERRKRSVGVLEEMIDRLQHQDALSAAQTVVSGATYDTSFTRVISSAEMQQLSEVKERLGVEKTVGKLIDLLGDRIAHRVDDEIVGHRKSDDDAVIASNCHWASDVVVQILTAEPLSIEAERKMATIDFSIHGPGVHSYVVFKTEDGAERALVHGDDVAADRREVDGDVDGEVIAGQFVLTDPGMVEAYWEAVDEKAEELTQDAQVDLATRAVNSASLDEAVKWADSLNYQLDYPLIAEVGEESGSAPQAEYFKVPASDVLKAMPDAALIEFHQRDIAEKDLDRKPSRQLFRNAVPALLRSLKRMGDFELENLAEGLGVRVKELRVKSKDEAVDVLQAIVVRTHAETIYGSEAAEVIEHPTITPDVTND